MAVALLDAKFWMLKEKANWTLTGSPVCSEGSEARIVTGTTAPMKPFVSFSPASTATLAMPFFATLAWDRMSRLTPGLPVVEAAVVRVTLEVAMPSLWVNF